MHRFIDGKPWAQTHTRPTRLKTFLFGAPYYPEHWSPAYWERDAQRMAEAGFNVVRMAEFAWDRMEPVEGQYDFSLFQEVIAIMGRHGIATILCTPTATPPRWLTHAHPDVLRVLPDGRRCTHGSRQHACYAGERYRAYSRAITQAMAAAFKDNAHVVGWQTDNEINCGPHECICPNCQTEFRRFLESRYGTIETLNEAWGTAFWAQTYQAWEQIDLPCEALPQSENPSARLDYYRYLSHIAVRFQREQVAILRAANPDWFVTHNGMFDQIDYVTFCRDLDFFGYDNYPGFRVDTAATPADGAAATAVKLDMARSFSGNFIIPEQQSGPGGQKHYLHDNPRPGQMRLWSYQSIAHGADGILHFRWRTCRFGAEEYWCGILDHDDVPRRRYREAQQEGREFAALAPKLLGTRVRVDVGLLHSPEQDDAHRAMPHGLPVPSAASAHLHRALWARHVAVGYINPVDRFDGLRALVWPHFALCNAATAERLAAFVRDGGVLLIGGRSAIKDVHNHVIAETPPGLLAELAGATVEEYGMRPERHFGICLPERVQPALWYDVLRPTTATVIGTWSGGHLEGQPAVTLNRYGVGQVLTIGTYLAPETAPWMADLLLRYAGVTPLVAGAPAAVEATLRVSDERRLLFLLNHDEIAHTVRGIPAGTDLLSTAQAGGKPVPGALQLEPWQVAIIELAE
jgi:beta-galactosidase